MHFQSVWWCLAETILRTSDLKHSKKWRWMNGMHLTAETVVCLSNSSLALFSNLMHFMRFLPCFPLTETFQLQTGKMRSHTSQQWKQLSAFLETSSCCITACFIVATFSSLRWLMTISAVLSHNSFQIKASHHCNGSLLQLNMTYICHCFRVCILNRLIWLICNLFLRLISLHPIQLISWSKSIEIWISPVWSAGGKSISVAGDTRSSLGQHVCVCVCETSEIRPMVSGVHPFPAAAADGTVSAYHMA